MGKRYEIGEYVVYGASGVCCVEEIRTCRLMPEMPLNEYYVLKPNNSNSSTVFVPTDNSALQTKMRPVLTKDEVDALIASVGTDMIYWIDDRKERSSAFRAVLHHGDRRDLILLIRCLLLRSRELAERNRHLAMNDSDILQAAQRAVREEFSFALGLKPDAVSEYVRIGLGLNEDVI